MQKRSIHIVFTEPVLGSTNNNPEVFSEYQASKAPTPEKKEEEIKVVTGEMTDAEVEETVEKQTTIFPKEKDGSLFCWDYQFRGFFKEAMGVGTEIGDKAMGKLSKWTLKKCVDSMLFVVERRIPFMNAEGRKIMKEDIKLLERPLRAQTMRGERICLARSEVVPAGSTVDFTVQWLECQNVKSTYNIKEEAITWALEYAALKGFGQWRGGGFGRFTYTMTNPNGEADKKAA